jgi:hypothetical protein
LTFNGGRAGHRVGEDPTVVRFGDRTRDGEAENAAAAVASAAGLESVEALENVLEPF